MAKTIEVTIPADPKAAAHAAAARIRERRKGVKLGRLKLKELIAEGRR
jgi:hypothetical protein